jgi:transcriptional regulator with XRE-family HTH domain
VNVQPVGSHLRQWRQRRRLSQLDLAVGADISTRHLSFLETGRSSPSREMILRLAEQLEIPMRERNVLLVAGGYAPMFPERALSDPALAPARAAIDLVLEGHKPYPAFALDRHWNVVASNSALQECGSACIRTVWRRASRTMPSGARIFYTACASRSNSPPIRS